MLADRQAMAIVLVEQYHDFAAELDASSLSSPTRALAPLLP